MKKCMQAPRLPTVHAENTYSRNMPVFFSFIVYMHAHHVTYMDISVCVCVCVCVYAKKHLL